jgi:hypothetical protein
MKELQELIELAAKTGAEVALKTMEKERQADKRELVDRRLHNTKLLLRNYRMFKAHVDNAVYEIEEEYETPEQIMADLMKPGEGSMFVESIKRSVTRTAIMLEHIEAMTGLYQAYCHMTGKEEDERRWRIIYYLYLSEEPKSVEEIAADEYVTERTVYRDVDTACERIAALIFGIDGIKRK